MTEQEKNKRKGQGWRNWTKGTKIDKNGQNCTIWRKTGHI